MRGTGMLVTAQQRGLIRFPGFRDFAALCVFEDPQGNELLREMENPQHDQFEPSRLPEQDRARGRRALNRITRWIRDEVKRVAGPPEGDGPTALPNCRHIFPTGSRMNSSRMIAARNLPKRRGNRGLVSG